MFTVTIDASAVLPIILVLILSAFAGAGIFLLGVLASGVGEFALGVAEVIAGGRPRNNVQAPRNKAFVFLRVLIYLGLCIGAIVLSLTGFQGFAYLAAVVGGVCLPIAGIKLLG